MFMEGDPIIVLDRNQESETGRIPYASFTRCNFNPIDSRPAPGLWLEVSKKMKSIAEAFNRLWTVVFRRLTPGSNG